MIQIKRKIKLRTNQLMIIKLKLIMMEMVMKIRKNLIKMTLNQNLMLIGMKSI